MYEELIQLLVDKVVEELRVQAEDFSWSPDRERFYKRDELIQEIEGGTPVGHHFMEITINSMITRRFDRKR